MGLIGNLAGLLASGSRHVPSPPPPLRQTGPDSTQATSAAPPRVEGVAKPAVATSGPSDPNARPSVRPAEDSPAMAAQSVPRQGTPADANPTRADFGMAPRPADEDSARAYAVAAQAGERLATLVKGLADAPEASPTAARAEKPEPPLGGAGINSTLPTLRGENVAGAVLDKVA